RWIVRPSGWRGCGRRWSAGHRRPEGSIVILSDPEPSEEESKAPVPTEKPSAVKGPSTPALRASARDDTRTQRELRVHTMINPQFPFGSEFRNSTGMSAGPG